MGKTFAKIYLTSTDDHPTNVNDKAKGWVENNGGHFSLDIIPETTHLLASKRSLKNNDGIVKEAQKQGGIKIVKFCWLEDSLMQASRRPKPTAGYEWDQSMLPFVPEKKTKLSNFKRCGKRGDRNRHQSASEEENDDSTKPSAEEGNTARSHPPTNDHSNSVSPHLAADLHEHGDPAGSNESDSDSTSARPSKKTRTSPTLPPQPQVRKPRPKMTEHQKAERKRKAKIREVEEAGKAFGRACMAFEKEMGKEKYEVYASPAGFKYSINLVRHDICREISKQMKLAGLEDIETWDRHLLQLYEQKATLPPKNATAARRGVRQNEGVTSESPVAKSKPTVSGAEGALAAILATIPDALPSATNNDLISISSDSCEGGSKDVGAFAIKAPPGQAKLKKRPSRYAVYSIHLTKTGEVHVTPVMPKGSTLDAATGGWKRFLEKRSGREWEGDMKEEMEGGVGVGVVGNQTTGEGVDDESLGNDESKRKDGGEGSKGNEKVDTEGGDKSGSEKQRQEYLGGYYTLELPQMKGDKTGKRGRVADNANRKEIRNEN